MGTRLLCKSSLRGCAYHPHACGDKYVLDKCDCLVIRSSPRVWGQEVADKVSVKSSGIIPTRVGTRRFAELQRPCSEDHPHACGDKLFVIRLFDITQGSSPRVWGQGKDVLINTLNHRIIPTRVGTRRHTWNVSHTPTDHPHACGDKTMFDFCATSMIGSSPRVWGQVHGRDSV